MTRRQMVMAALGLSGIVVLPYERKRIYSFSTNDRFCSVQSPQTLKLDMKLTDELLRQRQVDTTFLDISYVTCGGYHINYF